jgi:hypothetical protein
LHRVVRDKLQAMTVLKTEGCSRSQRSRGVRLPLGLCVIANEVEASQTTGIVTNVSPCSPSDQNLC